MTSTVPGFFRRRLQRCAIEHRAGFHSTRLACPGWLPPPGDVEKSRRVLAVSRASCRDTRHNWFDISALIMAIGLSPSRLGAWQRAAKGCELEDQSSCPTVSPQGLTPGEVSTIGAMVTSPDYRHIPTGRLAVLAQRIGKVIASPSTWYRLVRERGWRRPRFRIHPAKPRVGIRATKPNEVWHIDATVIRLLDGSHVSLHAVIDNFSRRILSWCLAVPSTQGAPPPCSSRRAGICRPRTTSRHSSPTGRGELQRLGR